MSPLEQRKEGSVGSSIRRNQRKSNRDSEGDQSGSPTKRTNSKANGGGSLGEGRTATKVSRSFQDCNFQASFQ